LPWQVLAAISWVESRHAEGRADPATGEVSPPIIGPALDGSPGVARIVDPTSSDGWAHALGPMQFLSTTWSQWATLAPGRPGGATPDVQNAWDAIYSAAAKLCADAGESGDLYAALFSYNPSKDYVDAVLTKAVAYGWGAVAGSSGASVPATAVEGATVPGSGDAVVRAAMQVLGVPYVWGGDSPETGFDCSGLVQWAYAQVGSAMPRITFDQARIGVPITVDQLQPGDLVFTRGGSPPTDLGHVMIYAGNGIVIAAPHTGTVVQFQLLNAAEVQAARRVLLN
jgi:cell wall-associated NlpC family hydrolase